MKKVFVSGGTSERLTVVRPYVDGLIRRGFEITHDWTRCPLYDRESTEDERREQARRDLNGVRAADLVWLMMPEAKSEGAHVELGASLILCKPTVVSGPRARAHGNLFSLLASEIWDNHRAGFDAVLARLY